MLKLGVIGTSRKEIERRMPLHPDHLPRLPEKLRRQLVFEEGYGAPFGVTDAEIASQTGGIATRHERICTDCGVTNHVGYGDSLQRTVDVDSRVPVNRNGKRAAGIHGNGGR